MLVDLGFIPAWGSIVLAQDPDPPPGQGPEFGQASPVALVVVLVLGLALILLVRSMTKHLKKVPVTFDLPEETPKGDAAPVVPPAEEPKG